VGTVQRLNLALFVGAQNEGMLGRIEVQTDDVLQFLCEGGIAAEFEGSYLVRLQPMSAPDAPYTGLADAGRRRHRARRPVRGVGWLLMQRHLHHSVHPAVGNDARSAWPRRVLLQSGDAAGQKAL